MHFSEKQPLKGRHTAFFSPEEDFWTNPSLLCIIEAILSSGAHVDVFTATSKKDSPIAHDISLYPFPMRFRKWYGGVKKSLGNWEKWACGIRAHHILKSHLYDLVFGVNAEGVVAAMEYQKRWRVPFVYLSYEMLFRDELSHKARLRQKREETEASRLADLIILQDPRRGYLFSQENSIGRKRMFWLPVSPQREGTDKKSSYLRERYQIPPQKKIIIHSGSFKDWTYAKELLESARHWRGNEILVVHCKNKDLKRRRTIRKFSDKNIGSNIIFSAAPLENPAYEEMISSADIGLCLYKEIPGDPFLQKNIRHMGLSSGKFSYYAKHGLPIISVRSKTYSRLQDCYKFGEDIEQFSELSNAIRKIIDDYDTYSKASQRFFEEKLAFDLHWPSLLGRISALL